MPTSLTRLHQVADAMLAIETAMRETGYWQQEAPSPAAMASRTPFCADTLAFNEWLQFVFIPRMRLLIENNADLPAASAIAPLAEQSLDERSGKQNLVDKLRRFDRLIGGEEPD